MHKILKQKEKICFSRWSRRNYALFSCLGKEVVIGTLRYEMTEAGEVTKRKVLNFNDKSNVNLISDDNPDPEVSEESLFFQTGLVCPVIAVSLSQENPANNCFFIISGRRLWADIAHGRFFLVISG